MKIVFGTDVFYPILEGGGEIHTFNVAKKLAKFGHEVTVISGKSSQFPDDPMRRLTTLKDEEFVDGIHIIRAKKPYRFGSTLSSLPALYEMYTTVKNMVKKGEVDIVNFVLYRPVIPLYLAAKGKVPTVLTVHLLSSRYGDWRGWMDYDGGIIGGIAQKLVETLVLKMDYDCIMTVSKSLAMELRKFYPNKKKKIEIIYNGVDLETYDNVKAGEKSENQLIFIGALKKRKNVLDAIRAVKIAREKSKRNLRLIIISGGGELESEVLRMREKYGFIDYYKKASDETKIRLLKESTLMIFPSSYESFGLVSIEALACKTPFIAYDIPAMKEVQMLTSGGILVPYKNINALADKINDLLENARLLKELRERGRQNVEKKFTWEIIARKVERIFKRVISESSK